MNAGLSNLKSLRGWLLAPDMENDERFDEQLLLVGRGVAAALESYCRRRFARAAGDTFEISCDRMHVNLPRYPVEAITKIEKRAWPAAAFAEVEPAALPHRLRQASGVIEFEAVPGTRLDDLRFTWTGGYWFDETEDGSGELPEGACPLPPDLLLAWQRQCEHVWQKHAKTGVPLDSTKTEIEGVVGGAPLHPQVPPLLQPFKRFSL